MGLMDVLLPPEVEHEQSVHAARDQPELCWQLEPVQANPTLQRQ
jgi:hypothetical protein